MAEISLATTALIVIGFGILTIAVGVYLLLSDPPDEKSLVTGIGSEFGDEDCELE